MERRLGCKGTYAYMHARTEVDDGEDERGAQGQHGDEPLHLVVVVALPIRLFCYVWGDMHETGLGLGWVC
jgi:hypothetical protein